MVGHAPARIASLERLEWAEAGRLRLRFAIDAFAHTVHVLYHDRPALGADSWDACVELLSLACLVDLSTVSMAGTARTVPFNPGATGRAMFESAASALRLELLWENGRSTRTRRIRLESTRRARACRSTEETHPNRVLLLMGGGKDSLYTLTLLRRAGYDVECFYLTEPRRTWQQLRRVYAALSSELTQHRAFLDINRMGRLERRHRCGYASQFQIGHVIGAALPYALSRGCRYVALGLERSSDIPTLRFRGLEINHQHQKSSRFIRLVNRHLRWKLGGAVEVVSPLHGLHDTGIFARFLAQGGPLLELQSSCGGSNSRSRHCGNCEKCAFLAALFAGLGRSRALYERMFTRDPLDDVRMFDNAWGARRPLGCVGLVEEVESALDAAAARGWEGAVVRRWRERAGGRARTAGLDRFLDAGPNALLPAVMHSRIAPLLAEDRAAAAPFTA